MQEQVRVKQQATFSINRQQGTEPELVEPTEHLHLASYILRCFYT